MNHGFSKSEIALAEAARMQFQLFEKLTRAIPN